MAITKTAFENYVMYPLFECLCLHHHRLFLPPLPEDLTGSVDPQPPLCDDLTTAGDVDIQPPLSEDLTTTGDVGTQPLLSEDLTTGGYVYTL